MRHNPQATTHASVEEAAITIKDLQPFSPEQLANMAPKHAPPVPPGELTARWNDEYKRLPYSASFPSGTFSKYVAHQAAAWGWEQAIPEREELAGLLQELTPQVAELANLLAGDGFTNDAQSVYELADRARAAAERLRGGDADG
jgi:hypothetical protein